MRGVLYSLFYYCNVIMRKWLSKSHHGGGGRDLHIMSFQRTVSDLHFICPLLISEVLMLFVSVCSQVFIFVSVLLNLWSARDSAIMSCCLQCLRRAGPRTLLQNTRSLNVLGPHRSPFKMRQDKGS